MNKFKPGDYVRCSYPWKLFLNNKKKYVKNMTGRVLYKSNQNLEYEEYMVQFSTLITDFKDCWLEKIEPIIVNCPEYLKNSQQK